MPLKKLTLLVLIALFLIIAPSVFADLPPDPGGGGPTGDPVGGGSPIGSGLLITFVMSTVYGIKKTIQYYKK